MNQHTPLSPIRHGTYPGYQKHIKRKIEPCAECRAAAAAYAKQNRVENPKRRVKERNYQKIYNKAVSELVARHAEEFAKLMTEIRNR